MSLQPTSVDPHFSTNSAFAFSDLFISSPSISLMSSRQSPSANSVRAQSARMKSVASWNGEGMDFFSDLKLHSPHQDVTQAEDEDQVEWEGFTWGPTLHAFSPVTSFGLLPSDDLNPDANSPRASSSAPRTSQTPLRPTPLSSKNSFQTPLRPSPALSGTSTVRRSRPISEQRQLQQLVDCVGMSARRRVLESGRKPKLLVLKRFDTGGQPSFERPRSSLGQEEVKGSPTPFKSASSNSPGTDPFSDATRTKENQPLPTAPAGSWEGRQRKAKHKLDEIEEKLDVVRQTVLAWEDR